MRSYDMVAFLFCVCLLMGGTIMAQERNAPDKKENVSSIICAKDPRFDVFCHPDARVEKVDSGDVPGKVLKESEVWIRRIVRPDWLPADLHKKLEPERKTLPFSDPIQRDLLRAELLTPAGHLEIVEGAGVCVSWASETIQVAGNPEKTAMLTAMCLLRLPKKYGQGCQLKTNKYVASDGREVYRILMRPKGARARPRHWYEKVTLWLGDGFVFIHVPRVTPKSIKKMSPTPRKRLPRRFGTKDSKKETESEMRNGETDSGTKSDAEGAPLPHQPENAEFGEDTK